MAVVALGLGGCGSSDGDVLAGPGDFGHVHDLVVDDSGDLLVATHAGLFRVEDVDRAVRVGTDHHDLMAMAGDLDGSLVASGHPDLRLAEYRVEGQPPHLGLVRSIDGGRSWIVTELLGEADFHALVPTADGLFAAEASGAVWHLDAAGVWEELGRVEARDLAVAPDDPMRQVAVDWDGLLWRSDDGAVTWTVVELAPDLVEIEWVDDGAFLAIDDAGSVWSAEDLSGGWVEVASGPAEPETLLVGASGEWWVASHGGAIARSDDQGGTWVDVYRPPDGP